MSANLDSFGRVRDMVWEIRGGDGDGGNGNKEAKVRQGPTTVWRFGGFREAKFSALVEEDGSCVLFDLRP